jgi:3-hydroxybutyryl-CoA dehydrogenase
MVIAVLADDTQKQELKSKPQAPGVEFLWAHSIGSLGAIGADAYFDLLFVNDPERITRLTNLLPKTVFINSITKTCKQINAPFVRINAWNTMLSRDIIELALDSEEMNHRITGLFELLRWKYRIVPDTPGMITPRIISMIINEAWFTLHEGISTKEEIDTAMKLGTNYPFGPFEWADKIGLHHIKELLAELAVSEPRYTIAPALKSL